MDKSEDRCRELQNYVAAARKRLQIATELLERRGLKVDPTGQCGVPVPVFDDAGNAVDVKWTPYSRSEP